MHNLVKWMYSIVVLGLLATGCGSDEEDPDNTTVESITQDTTWSGEVELTKHVFVGSGATLTIEAGTKILGNDKTSLVITAEGKIDAVGTADNPIVFTSAKDPGSRASGDWGGVVLLGKATINSAGGTDNIEGFASGTEGTVYGGTDDSHDCGTLQYVRIEFAGNEIAPDNELNGLTVGGCGSDTTLDYIQVHLGLDDGIEFFGGSANLRHAIVTQAKDDSLDTDQGYTGNVQFFIAQQSATTGNFAFEMSSSKAGATPASKPIVWNCTLIGSNAEPDGAAKVQKAAHFKDETQGEFHNCIIAHFADYAFDVDGEAVVAAAESGNLIVSNSIFWDNGDDDNEDQSGFLAEEEDLTPDNDDDNPTNVDNDDGFDEDLCLFNGEGDCEDNVGNLQQDPNLPEAATNLTNPNWQPTEIVEGEDPPGGFFGTAANHIGAIGDTDWTADWTAYPSN